MTARPIDSIVPFDAVIFDLDGTLVATDRYWPQAAQVGATQAFEELGLTRPVPSEADWMGLVGGELGAGFRRILPDLDDSQREHVLRRCLEMEHAYLAEGRAVLLPGVEATLEQLHQAGVRMGIASNCSQRYLDQMLEDLQLSRWIDEPRCLHSPRVRNKADMIEDLLICFDTRSACMVGDRIMDRDAAWANGLPHVHLTEGYAVAGEQFPCEATLATMSELVPLLRCRTAGLEGLLESLLPGSAEGFTLAITGDPAAGKTLMARDLARLVQGARGESSDPTCDVLALEDFRVGTERVGADPLAEAFDLEAFGRRLEEGAGDRIRIVEGPWLGDPRVRPAFDHLIHLELSAELSLRRIQGRDGRGGGLAPVERAREVLLPLHATFARDHPPSGADRLLRGENPFHPA